MRLIDGEELKTAFPPGETVRTESVRATIDHMPTIEPRQKGKWILNRSGAYCCSKCMEPCATYVMMRPRDRFCKMCGARMEKEDME